MDPVRATQDGDELMQNDVPAGESGPKIDGGRRGPLRILYVTPDITAHGGIETYGRELMQGMAARGHEVAVVEAHPARFLDHVGPLDYFPPTELWRRYYLWRRVAYEDFRFHTALWRRVRQQTRNFRPNVVHSLHVHLYGALIRMRVPAIVTAHGLEIEAIPPIIASVSTARAVHCNSAFTESLVHARLSRRAPTWVLSWGVAGASQPRTRADFDLVSVCRLVRRKNIDTVLRSLSMLPHLKYAVVGDGPDLPALRELARALNLSGVTFFGAVSEQERSDVLSRSRCFVMCPRTDRGDVEGLGLVYYEALAAGLPIVGAQSGGAPEAIGRAGVLIANPENADELARAIQTVLSPERYRELTAEVAHRQSHDSWDSFLARFEALYATVATS